MSVDFKKYSLEDLKILEDEIRQLGCVGSQVDEEDLLKIVDIIIDIKKEFYKRLKPILDQY